MRLIIKFAAPVLLLAGIFAAWWFYQGSSVDEDDDSDVADVNAGRLFAERNCARCHAIGVDGESPFAPAPPFRTFAKKWPLESIEEALAEGIVVGHPAMPEFELTPRQIRDLIGYMETIQR